MFGGDDRSIVGNERVPASHFDPDADALNEVVMAVNMTERGTVGCAYYAAREEKLYFMEDVKMGGADVVEQCVCP